MNGKVLYNLRAKFFESAACVRTFFFARRFSTSAIWLYADGHMHILRKQVFIRRFLSDYNHFIRDRNL